MRATDLPAIISDIQFSSNRVDPTTFTVKLHDHSGLGGPMGSEHTRVIESWTFANAELAKSFAKLLIERMAVDDSRIHAERDVAALFQSFDTETRYGYDSLVDLASVGVSIAKDRGGLVIQGFTYDRPTVERVAA